MRSELQATFEFRTLLRGLRQSKNVSVWTCQLAPPPSPRRPIARLTPSIKVCGPHMLTPIYCLRPTQERHLRFGIGPGRKQHGSRNVPEAARSSWSDGGEGELPLPPTPSPPTDPARTRVSTSSRSGLLVSSRGNSCHTTRESHTRSGCELA